MGLEKIQMVDLHTEPTGYIQFGDELMPFWLPENVDPDSLDIEWIEP